MNALESAARGCLKALTRRAGLAYISGQRLDDAISACEYLRERETACSMGFWNREGDDPKAIVEECLRAIEAAGRARLDCKLAVKLAPMRFDAEGFERIAELSSQHHIRLVCDAMRFDTADETLALARAMATRHAHIAVALPARWRRSLDDAEFAVEHGLGVRIVKGECPDPAGDADVHGNFIAMVERIAGRASLVGIATHDLPLAREALAILRSSGTHCEHELLMGLPMRACARAARESGVKLRVYVPYGHPSLPYSLTDARFDVRLAARAMRDLVLGRSLRPQVG